MAAASDIGANFSQYTGDPSLGGGTLGAVRIDTRPFEDLARYTMLYQREEWLQRQKEAEKAAEELAKFTQIDLSTTIPKDAKILQEKYDKVIDYVRQNPGALQFKNRDQWIEYNKLKSDLMNDTKFAAIRSLINVSRLNKISEETSEDVQNFQKKKLQENINATDIRTPLDFDQKVDMSIPDFGTNQGIEVITAKRAPNEIFRDKAKLFDVAEANRIGAAVELGLSSIDSTTTTGKLKILKANENFWVRGSQILNQAIQSAKTPQGVIDKTKLAGLPLMQIVDDYNNYIAKTKAEIATGKYKDALGNGIQFGQGSFRIADYEPIKWEDEISPGELSKLYQYAKWAGDQRLALDVIQTNELIEKQRLALGWANLNLEKDKLEELKKKSGSNLTNDIITADSVLSNISNAIKLHKVVDVPDATKKTGLKRYLEISDINLIEKYGKLGLREEIVQGVKTEGAPNDRVLFSQDENRFYLGHYDKNNKLIIGPQFSIEDWADNLTAGKMGASERGSVNTIISEVIRKYGNDALKLAYSYEGISPTIEKGGGTKTSEVESSSKTIKGKTGKNIFVPE